MEKFARLGFRLAFVIMIFSAPSFAQTTIVDEILRDYKNSKTFADFLALQQPKIVPGDDAFLFKKLKNSSDMLAAKKLPSLSYFNGSFNLKYLDSSIQLRLADKSKFEFEINGQRVILHPSMVPSIRFTKINEAIMPKKTSFISWMPVAFAQQNGEPTFSNIITFSIVSRLALEAAGGLDIKTENPKISFIYFIKKARQKKTPCDYVYLTELLKKMSAIQVAAIQCDSKHKNKNGDSALNGNIQFDLPFGEGLFRKLTVNRSEQSISEVSPDYPDKKINYKKIFNDDSIIFSPLSSQVSQIYHGGKSVKKAMRQKGMSWTPVGSFGANAGEIQERAEQIRELAHILISSDFCIRCGLTLQKSLKEIAKEMEMNPDLDQYGNTNIQSTQPGVKDMNSVGGDALGTSAPASSVMDLPPMTVPEQSDEDSAMPPELMKELSSPPPPPPPSLPPAQSEPRKDSAPSAPAPQSGK